MCISFVLWAGEHIPAMWKGRLKVTYVPWWTSACFDVQAITDLLYRYQPETGCFQFLKCKPSFFLFFFFSWYSGWTVTVSWCWTISGLHFPLISLRTTYFKEGKLLCRIAIYSLITEWISQAWGTFFAVIKWLLQIKLVDLIIWVPDLVQWHCMCAHRAPSPPCD